MIDQLIQKYAGVGMNFLEAAIIFIIGWYAVKFILHILSKMMERSQIDAIIERIPGLNKIDISSEKVEKRLGFFGQPVIVAFFLGLIIGVLAKYDVKNTLQLAIKVAAVIALMPKVIKPIMDGLLPISEVVKEKLSNLFKRKKEQNDDFWCL